MRSINPTVKFFALLAVTFLLAYKFDARLNLLVFLLAVIAMLCSGVRPKKLLFWMIPIAIAAVGMFFTGYRFSANASMPVVASDFLIYDSKVWNGLAHASRVFAYAGVGFLFTFTTDSVELVQSMQAQLRLPKTFCYGILAAWGIVPHMLLEYKKARIAFRARGISVAPVSPALLKPLLIKSIRWSEELAIAMESKGFSNEEPRTSYEEIRVHARDWIFLVAVVGAVAALVIIM